MHSGCIGLYLGIKPGKIVHCHCHLPLHTNGYRSLYFSISGFSQIELRLGLLCHYFQQNTFQTGWAGQKKEKGEGSKGQFVRSWGLPVHVRVKNNL